MASYETKTVAQGWLLVVVAVASLALIVDVAPAAEDTEGGAKPKGGGVGRAIEHALARDAKNVQREWQRLATRQTAEFIDEHLYDVQVFPDRMDLLEFSVSQVDPNLADGLWAEFGVFSGRTINHVAAQTDRTVHGFDSFEGLPEDWLPGFPKGTFKMEKLPEVRSNVELHKGWFEDSVPEWAAAHEGPMAFIHFDADLYSSTKTVLDVLADRIVPGTILQFDEFFNYPGWKHGEYRAFMEFVERRKITFEYIGYASKRTTEQVAIRVTGAGT